MLCSTLNLFTSLDYEYLHRRGVQFSFEVLSIWGSLTDKNNPLTHDALTSKLNYLTRSTHSSCCCCARPGCWCSPIGCCPPCWARRQGSPGRGRRPAVPRRPTQGRRTARWRPWAPTCCQCSRPPGSAASCPPTDHNEMPLCTCTRERVGVKGQVAVRSLSEGQVRNDVNGREVVVVLMNGMGIMDDNETLRQLGSWNVLDM